MADYCCTSIFLVVFWILLTLCTCDEPPIMRCPSPKSGLLSGINIARLVVNTHEVNSTIILQLISAQCHTCDLQNASVIPVSVQNCSVTLDTRWPVRMAIISDSTADIVDQTCQYGNLSYTFNENGEYNIIVKMNNKAISCQGPSLSNDTSDSNITIYATMGIFTGLALIWIGFMTGRRRLKKLLYEIHPSTDDTNVQIEHDLGIPTNSGKTESKPKKRLKSLDTFRGISLVVMMFVNYGGADYWFFQHSTWNGLTVADLVFPWFIWIMGAAMAYSYVSLARQNVGKGKLFVKILRRSVILFALGILVNSGGSNNFTIWRIMGVLQRFSLSYLVTATLHMFVMNDANNGAKGQWKDFRDITNYWKEWIAQLLLVIVHSCITFLLNVPGCPTGYLGPGGLANDGTGNVSLCTGGAAGYVDRSLFGDELIYNAPTCAEVYDTTVPYDPEGLLGVLTSCFLCFLGLQAGKILVNFPRVQSRIKRFLIWSVILGSISALLCKASKNDGWIPINKNLWSLSYVLAMASMAFVLLAICYLLVDVYKIWNGAPFYYPGMNSIVVYVCHEVFTNPFQTFWDITPYTHATYMLINVWDVSFWILLSFYLYQKKIFISV